MSRIGRFGMTHEERARHRARCPLLRHRFRAQVAVQLVELTRAMKQVNAQLKARACKQTRLGAKKKRR